MLNDMLNDQFEAITFIQIICSFFLVFVFTESVEKRRKFKLEPKDNIFAEKCFRHFNECESLPCLNGGKNENLIFGFSFKNPSFNVLKFLSALKIFK